MAKSARLGICFLGFLLAGSVVFAQTSEGPTIERIDIRGNRRIPEETIRFYIQSRAGDPFSEERLAQDLRSVFNAHFFENIEIQERDGDAGKIVTFVVKEKPLIRQLEYVGNKSFTESNILDEFKERKVGLTIDSQFDPSKIEAAKRALRMLLMQNGRPLGTVRSEIDNLPPSSVRVRFIIDEGPKVRIGQIRFVGNKIFKDQELRDSMKLTKERSMMTAFKHNDMYQKERLDYDIEMNLKAFYKAHGYMYVQVGEPVTRIFEGPRGSIPMVRKTKQQFYIEVPIDAGEQYRLGKLELKNCDPFKCEFMKGMFGLKTGDVLNHKRITDTLDQIKKIYGAYGYINWNYLSEMSSDPKNKTIDLSFEFQPEKQFFVRFIQFLGNTKTRDKVIRREMILEEGKIFSSQALENSVLRINQLGFFEKIEEKDYEVKPDDKNNLVDVNITVKEKSQRSIGFSGGVSGISGSFIGINYSDNNFMGRGEAVQASITGGTRQTDFVVSFTEPYLLDSRWGLGLSFYNRRYRYDTYTTYGLVNTSGNAQELFTQKTLGTTISLSRRLGRSLWTFGTSYTRQRIGVDNIAPGYEYYALGQFYGYSPAGATNNQLKGIIRSELTPSLSYNSTDAYFFPTRGKAIQVSTAVSGGFFGGDFKMVRPELQYRRYFRDRWLSHGRNIFAFNLQAQIVKPYGDSFVPFFDRFYIGGENTIRGFDIRSISPLAISSSPLYDSLGNPVIDPKTGLPKVVQSLIPVGGDTVGIFNFEYRIPIAGPLSVSAFYDVGINRVSFDIPKGSLAAGAIDVIDSTNNQVRGSTGLEIGFVLPVVSAPFRLIFAFNPQRLVETIDLNNRIIRLKEPLHDIKFTVGRSF
ncbi:MAG TPA: outer membrane protein assembly factor BamA [Acidobacteriota bacterium]|nr:outer membrane protein assembly factor BamA [Acidobacteriota bacterium]